MAQDHNHPIDRPNINWTKNFKSSSGRTIQLLGIKERTVSESGNAEQTLIKVIRGGILKRSLDQLMEVTGMTAPEITRLIHISDRTLRRYEPDQAFPAEQGEKIVALASLYTRGEAVFGSIERFNEWMDRPQIAFGNATPRSYLDTTVGISLILDELGRIEHGIFA